MNPLVILGMLVGGAISGRGASQSGSRCKECGCPISAGKGVVFDCCGTLRCTSCASDFATSLGGGRFHVHCSCGSNRISSPR